MHPIEKTTCKGVCVKYYSAQKNGVKQITAQLTDQRGPPIPNVWASYTIESANVNIDHAKIFARSRTGRT